MKKETTIPVFKMSDFEKFSDEDVRTVTNGFSVRGGAYEMLSQRLIATLANMKRLTICNDPQFLEFPTERANAILFFDLANSGLVHTHGGKSCLILAVCKLPEPLTVIKGNSVSTTSDQKAKICLIIGIDMGKAANHNRGRSLNNPEKSGGNIIINMTSTAVTTKPRKGAAPNHVSLSVPWFVINSKGEFDFENPDIEIVFPPRTKNQDPPDSATSRTA